MRFCVSLLTILLLSKAVQAQHDFSELLTEGKALYRSEMKRSDSGYVGDFSKAIIVLRQALAVRDTSAEAWYWLGYALDKVNAPDGTFIPFQKPWLTEAASDAFQKVVSLQPDYKGEMLAIDPYEKQTALWGALALKYLAYGNKDSAAWAFREGKKRGGYNDQILALRKHLLTACDSNAIFISYGDAVTFPLLYLQIMERVRPDVSVIDHSLLGVIWYEQYIRREHPGLIQRPQDSDAYYILTESSARINFNHTDSITWLLRTEAPFGSLYRNEMLLLDILEHNQFRRPVWTLAWMSDEELLGLGSHLSPLIEGAKLLTDENNTVDKGFMTDLKTFPWQKVAEINPFSPSDLIDLVWIRYSLLAASKYYLLHGQKAIAKTVMSYYQNYCLGSKYPAPGLQDQNFYKEMMELLK